jgi:hypothetical protein
MPHERSFHTSSAIGDIEYPLALLANHHTKAPPREESLMAISFQGQLPFPLGDSFLVLLRDSFLGLPFSFVIPLVCHSRRESAFCPNPKTTSGRDPL